MTMAIIKKKELAALPAEALAGKLDDVEKEFWHEIGTVRNGGRAQNPGRIRELRRTAARLKMMIARGKKIGEVKPSA